MAPADDGFWMSFDGTPIITNDWVLKGRWGQVYPDVQIEGGRSYALDAWFYEFGGGASTTLTYSPDNGLTWATVPSEFFTTEAVVPVTPPSLNTPVNVQAVAQGTDVLVTWDTPEDTGTPIERYAVTWNYGEGNPGWGIGVVGNSAVISNLPFDTEIKVYVRADNDTVPVYSRTSEAVAVTIPKPVEPPVDPPVDPVDPPVEPPVEPVKPPVVPQPEPPVVPQPPVVIPEPPVVKPEVPSVTEVDPGTIDPTELTTEEVAELKAVAYETFETAEPGSEEYAVALEQLMVAAQADDIVVDEEIAAIPLIGNLAVGLVDAFNFAGNIGADMSPKVRELAEKQVLVSVVAVGAAVQAAAGAATSAAAAAASSPSSRRN
jgi:hypothetical protein